ncbi:MAG: electron transfer flavoprotein subunit alpha/FixB family protein [Candidatus Nezhaarchaeota archaeon]|nr:electron transfer flavoprotein subunit alpha/FixB family protein [Candidatus Nezhaarchaeota archaeon]
MSGGVLSVMEINEEDNSLDNTSFELLEAGGVLSKEAGTTISAAIIGRKASHHADNVARYVDRVYVVEHEALASFNPYLHLHALEKVLKLEGPSYILMGHTYKGVDIAARLAARLKAPLTTDCIGLELDPQTRLLKRRRQVYGGAVIATFIYQGEPQLVTLRPKVWRGRAEPRQVMGDIIQVDLDINSSASKLRVIERVKEEAVRLDDADVIVSGGRGLGGPDGFKELEKLRSALAKGFKKVEIGSSRPPVDKGWISSSRQVGLTGEKVSPMIYIAVGISGATQHIVGMEKSKLVVAINSDKGAPIFTMADIGAVGDYRQILPSFIKKLEELL